MKNTNKPKVTVLIPVYNGAPFMEETVASVLKSSYKNIEIILVNDGSTDRSKDICRKLEARNKRIRFFDFAKNGGLTRSLNFGIKNAHGEYIARINQDDLMAVKRLEKQVRFLQTHPDYVVVGGYVNLFTSDNPKYGQIKFPLTDRAIRKSWMYLSPFADPSVMYRKDAYLKTKGYSQAMWPADDVHMWYQLGRVGKLANLPAVLTDVRWHKGAGSIKYHKIQMQKTLRVHKWAANNVAKPNLSMLTFWAGEYVAGVVFPPQFNWFVYRLIRKTMKFGKNIRIKSNVNLGGALQPA